MLTYLFDLDETILNLNWNLFEKDYYMKLAYAFSELLPIDKAAYYIQTSYRYMVDFVDNKRTNKDRFYDKMVELSGADKEKMIELEPHFYLEHYEDFKKYTYPNSNMVESVKTLNDKGFPLVIASNPVFPAIATLKRIAWAGLDASIFKRITTFENEYACKPRIEYYENLLKELQLKAEDCIMVGNDIGEDMMASLLNIKCILITDDVIDSGEDYEYESMSSDEFLKYVKEL